MRPHSGQGWAAGRPCRVVSAVGAAARTGANGEVPHQPGEGGEHGGGEPERRDGVAHAHDAAAFKPPEHVTGGVGRLDTDSGVVEPTTLTKQAEGPMTDDKGGGGVDREVEVEPNGGDVGEQL